MLMFELPLKPKAFFETQSFLQTLMYGMDGRGEFQCKFLKLFNLCRITGFKVMSHSSAIIPSW